MRVLLSSLCILALLAGAVSAGTAPTREAVKPAAGDPIAVRPAAEELSPNAFRFDGDAGGRDVWTLPTDGTWYGMNCDEYTFGPDGQGGWIESPCEAWQVDSPVRTVLLLTDFFFVGDRFEVWVDGAFAVRSGTCADDGTNWDSDGIDTDWSLYTQEEGCDRWVSPLYSGCSVTLPPGTHTVQVKVYRFASGFTDTGIAVKAEERWAKCPMMDGGAPKMMTIGEKGEEASSWGAVKTLFR